MVQVQSVTWATDYGCPCDWWWLVCLVHPLILVSRAGSPSPLIPLPSRERGLVGCVVLFTRITLPPLWIADQVRNDGHNSLIPDQVQNDGVAPGAG